MTLFREVLNHDPGSGCLSSPSPSLLQGDDPEACALYPFRDFLCRMKLWSSSVVTDLIGTPLLAALYHSPLLYQCSLHVASETFAESLLWNNVYEDVAFHSQQ